MLSTGVVGYQPAQPLICLVRRQKPRTVQWVKPGVAYRSGVSDVVQPRCGDKEIRVPTHVQTKSFGFRGHRLYMPPSAGK